MSESQEQPKRTNKAITACATWLAYCVEIGWSKEQVPGLEKVWWEHHDERGNLVAHKEPEVEGELQFHPDCKRNNSCGESIMSGTTDQCRLGCVWLSGKLESIIPSQEEPAVKAGGNLDWEQNFIVGGNPSKYSQVLLKVKTELNRAMSKHPKWNNDLMWRIGVVSEEAGELAKAGVQYVDEDGKFEEIEKEAIHVASTAFRFLMELDSASSQKQEALTDEDIEKEAAQLFDKHDLPATAKKTFTKGAKFARRRLTGK